MYARQAKDPPGITANGWFYAFLVIWRCTCEGRSLHDNFAPRFVLAKSRKVHKIHDDSIRSAFAQTPPFFLCEGLPQYCTEHHAGTRLSMLLFRFYRLLTSVRVKAVLNGIRRFSLEHGCDSALVSGDGFCFSRRSCPSWMLQRRKLWLTCGCPRTLCALCTVGHLRVDADLSNAVVCH